MTNRSQLRVTAHADTNVGLVREGNEDSYHCGAALFAVADGLGGHAAGEVASAIAVERLASVDPEACESPEEVQVALVEAVRDANRAVHDSAKAHRGRAGMATTLTAAAVHGDRLLLAHVGDSRAYLHRDGVLRQLTTDHTAAQEAIDAGQLSPAEAARHPARHALSRAVGLEDDVRVDAPPPVVLQPDDRVVLCSDGLTEPLDDEAVRTIVAEHQGPRAACEALMQAALDGGAPDNVTVIVVQAEAG